MRVSCLLVSALLATLCLGLCAVRGDDIVVDDPDVTVLTDSNFDNFVAQDLVLVEFYAPWCGHCKSLAPEYAQAATQLKADGVALGKLDATVHSSTSGRFSISGYPTLKIFRQGKAFEYNGPRKADGIVQYMRKQIGPAAKPISTEAELDALRAKDPTVGYVVLALFNEDKPSQLSSSFALLASKMRDDGFLMARSTSADLKKAYGIAPNGEALIAFAHGSKNVYEGSSKTSEVEQWIRLHSVPEVGEYSEATAALYQKRGLPVAKLFVNVDRTPKSKTMTYYTNRLRKIAQRFAGKIAVAYADRSGSKGALEHLNMQSEEHGFVVEDLAGNKQYKYESEEDDDSPAAGSKPKPKGLDVDGWIRHIEDYLNGDAASYVRSQRAPRNNLANAVKIATGNNFDELVNDDQKDVMIEFYAPWCGHCKALEPKYEQLGKKLQSAKADKIVIAKLDATANDYDRSKWEVKGYPTIFFKPAGKSAMLYEGAREVDSMFDFIKKNGKTLKKNKKKKASKKDSKQ